MANACSARIAGSRGNVKAFPADYAFLISGLIELHAVSPAAGWLEWAGALQQKLDAGFWDAAQSGYVMRPELAGETLMVIREDYDGAEPSPNHLAAENLLKLAVLLDHAGIREAGGGAAARRIADAGDAVVRRAVVAGRAGSAWSAG